MQMIPIPPSAEADARNRGARSFWQGLGIDVAVMLIVTVGPLLLSNDFAFTGPYWTIVGTSAAKTVVSAVVSYVTRKLIPPHFVPDREVKPAQPIPTSAQPGPIEGQERPLYRYEK